MSTQDQNTYDGRYNTNDMAVSRRVAVTTAGVAILGVVSATAFGREGAGEGSRREMSPDMRERIEQSRAFVERMRNAGSPEEQAKIMAERRAQDRARTVEGYKGQLGVCDEESSEFRGHFTNSGRVLFRAEMRRLSPEGRQRRGHWVREDVSDYPRWYPTTRKTHFVHRR